MRTGSSIQATTTPTTPLSSSQVRIVIASRLAITLLLSMLLSIGSTARAKDLTPLASGGAPPCSQNNGTREFHSSIIRDGDVSALIVGIAHRDRSECRRTAEIRVEQDGYTKSFPLPEADQQDFSIVDFSPDASKIFIAAEANRAYPNEQFRYVQITTMPISSGKTRWRNVWDLFGWKDCDATVESQGFTGDGKLAINVRPSVMSSPRRANCISDRHLYAVDENATAQISDAVGIERYGKIAGFPSQSCRSDPDLVGVCFIVHGTISAWNGAPTIRISRPGTKRMLGITERPFPASVPAVLPQPLAEKLIGEVAAAGDFTVCPFTVEQPGHMQMACVESATNLIFRPRR